MIDLNELRRLAQAATPHVGHACKYQDAHGLREGHVDFENADLFIASERPQEDAAFYAAANPATLIELLDRIIALEEKIDAMPQCTQPAPSVPEGWKLVPIEPTKEMRDAWDSAPICEDDDAEFRRAYSEMLAAAPETKP